jgi:hypothetical protein
MSLLMSTTISDIARLPWPAFIAGSPDRLTRALTIEKSYFQMLFIEI